MSSLVRKYIVFTSTPIPEYLDKLNELAKKRADEILKRIDILFEKQLECEDLIIQAFTPLQKRLLRQI